MSEVAHSEHPGRHIRRSVLPKGMKVAEAARVLKVGRPALSNMLNGKASLSPEMATRLEKAFGADRADLMRRQAEWEAAQSGAAKSSLPVGRNVPAHLKITAAQISDWGRAIDARAKLAVLLRRLIGSTVGRVAEIDFPGGDNSQRHGWDGWLVSEDQNPWVPSGKSGWEFGCSANPKSKADSDYAARSGDTRITDQERRDTVFVFVTPHDWAARKAWAKEKAAEGRWKEVLAFDASDLEAWLEQSIAAQTWLAEELRLSTKGVMSLSQCWAEWVDDTEPALVPELFAAALAQHEQSLELWLKKPPENALYLTADSRVEALGLLASLGALSASDALRNIEHRAVVISDPDSLKALAVPTAGIIPVIADETVERRLGSVPRAMHTIIVRPRSAMASEGALAVDSLPWDAFEKAAGTLGLPGEESEKWRRDCGGSLTVLRRLLSKNEAIKRPIWSQDVNVARDLIPMALIGAWDADLDADREVLCALAQIEDYDRIEERLVKPLALEDSPVWSIGSYRGVVSKRDALFSLAQALTASDLKNFFEIASGVLEEDDPALDLPEGDRWAASVYGKERRHSASLRNGICETLVFLAVHGNHLFKARTGVDCEMEVNNVVRALLTPLTERRLGAQRNDLSRYAEAAPDQFLKIMEGDLRKGSVVRSLLRPAESSPFGGCPRTDFLWALEALAWNQDYVLRVALLLAELSEIEINDNWMNKPESSLAAILRGWMPQTSAPLEDRKTILSAICEKFPAVGWALCVEQFADHQSGGYSHRPRWRDDATGHGEPVTVSEWNDFRSHALGICLAWPNHDGRTLGDLVEHVGSLPAEGATRVWELIEIWAAESDDDDAKAALKERIRRRCFTRRGRHMQTPESSVDRAAVAMKALTPRNLVSRHSWLFEKQWVEESLDELHDEEFDFDDHEKRIDALRRAAVRELWEAEGFADVKAMALRSEAPYVVGWTFAAGAPSAEASRTFIRACLDSLGGEKPEHIKGLLEGFLAFGPEERRDALVGQLLPALDDNEALAVAVLLPFSEATWARLGELPPDIAKQYWSQIRTGIGRLSRDGLREAVDRLLEARRPRAAFRLARFDWQELDTARLRRLLHEAATCDHEPPNTYLLEPYAISDALDELATREGMSVADLAQLEFFYLNALERSKHGIPNLERQLESSPILFIQILALAFRRSDDGEDPPEWKPKSQDAEQQSHMASRAYRLLNRMSRIPGTEESGINEQKLHEWVAEVRRLAREYAREEICDHEIGQLLARGPADADEAWPRLPIRNVMEALATEHLKRGFFIGVCNSRGAHWRGEGGDQERALAEKYRTWATAVRYSHPFVSECLREIADSYDHDAERQDSQAAIRRRLVR